MPLTSLPASTSATGDVAIVHSNPMLGSQAFEPVTCAEWIRRTSLSGRVYGTRKRGEKLVRLDEAYTAWWANQSDMARTDALKTALEHYLLRPSFGGVESHHLRDKDGVMRNTLDLLRKKMESRTSRAVVGYAASMAIAAESQREQLRTVRREILMVVANTAIDVKKLSLASGALGLCSGVADIVDESGSVDGLKTLVKSPAFQRDFMYGFAIGAGGTAAAFSGTAVVVGAGYGAVKAAPAVAQAAAGAAHSSVDALRGAIAAAREVRLPNLVPTMETVTAAAAAVGEITLDSFTEHAWCLALEMGAGVVTTASAAASGVRQTASAAASGVRQTARAAGEVVVAGAKLIWKILEDAFFKFKEWLLGVLAKVYGGDMEDLIKIVEAVLKITFKFACKSAAPFVGGAIDIAHGLNQAINTAIVQVKLATQRAIITTSEATFAAIRGSIQGGITRRQLLADWRVFKGALSITVTALSAGMGSAIAETVTAALDWGFKMILKLCENHRMKVVREQARLLVSQIERASTTTWTAELADRPPRTRMRAVLPALASGALTYKSSHSRVASLMPAAPAEEVELIAPGSVIRSMGRDSPSLPLAPQARMRDVLLAPPAAAETAPATPSPTAHASLQRGQATRSLLSEPLDKTDYTTGHMPDFRAASLSHISKDEFYDNKHGYFLIFLSAACRASPVMASAILASGVISEESSSVFHAVTSRTEADEAVAEAHIKLLKKQAKQIIRESGFSIAPTPMAMVPADIRDRIKEVINSAAVSS